MRLSKLTTTALLSTLILSTSGCIIHVGGNDKNNGDGIEYSSVFGGVDISANKRVGDLSSVNGNITIQNNVTAEDVNAVNGNIEIGQNVTVNDLSTVNGDIRAENNLSVRGDVGTVNGNITLNENSKVSQDVATVNGDIHLSNTTVADDITTKNGSITLAKGSVVEGDIEFESQDDNSWWGDKTREHNPPTLTIDNSSDVKGAIILRQVVILVIDNPAILAKVERRYKEQ